jgi:hypothetical protein
MLNVIHRTITIIFEIKQKIVSTLIQVSGSATRSADVVQLALCFVRGHVQSFGTLVIGLSQIDIPFVSLDNKIKSNIDVKEKNLIRLLKCNLIDDKLPAILTT